MGRRPCCSKEGLNRGAWSAREDHILVEYIKTHGEGKWRDLPRRAGLKRCGKSCRLRWLNYLRPDIKRGNISGDEEELIIKLHSLLGNRWSLIAGRLPGRTDNEIKNYWNTNLSKRVHGSSPRPSGAQRRLGKHEEKRKTVEPQPPDHLSGHRGGVIRTKASRCTKVFFPAALHEAAGGAKQHGEDLDFKCQEMPSPASPLQEDDDSFSNILLELNIDELMSTTEELGFLRTTPGGTGDQLDPSKNGGGDKGAVGGGGNGEEYMSTLPDHLFLSEEAILEEWRECLKPVEVTGVDAYLHAEQWVEQQCEP